MNEDNWRDCAWCGSLFYSPARGWLCADCWTAGAYYMLGAVLAVGCFLGWAAVT